MTISNISFTENIQSSNIIEMREIKNVYINNSIFENIEIGTKSRNARNLAEN
jgi:hypothetical protein